MDWKLLLGILIGLATSVFGNLLTPIVKSWWAAFSAWNTRGYHSSIRQQIKVLDNQREQILRHQAESNRDFFLYLSQWFLAIVTSFVLACACAFIAFTGADVTPPARANLVIFTLMCLIATLLLGLIMMSECRTLTSRGITKTLATIDEKKAKLVTQLPADLTK